MSLILITEGIAELQRKFAARKGRRSARRAVTIG